MATQKAVIVNATKKFFEARTIAQLLGDQGVKITEVNGNIELSITLATTELIAEQHAVVAQTWVDQLGAEITLENESDPVSQDEDNTEFEQVFTYTVALPEKAPAKAKKVKNLPLTEWPENGVIHFRVRNFNRPSDEIYDLEVPHADAAQWRETVVSGNGTGGFQMLLECHNADGELLGWAKKYCSREEAMAHVPDGENYKNPAQLEREAKAAAKAEAAKVAKAEKVAKREKEKAEKAAKAAEAKAEKAAAKAAEKAAKAAAKAEDVLNTEAAAEDAINKMYPDSEASKEEDAF